MREIGVGIAAGEWQPRPVTEADKVWNKCGCLGSGLEMGGTVAVIFDEGVAFKRTFATLSPNRSPPSSNVCQPCCFMRLFPHSVAAAISLLASAAFSQSVPEYRAEAAFPSAPGNSSSGLVKLPDGKLYGISPLGGEGGGGCVFKVDGGTVVAVASFSSIGINMSAGVGMVQRLVVHGSEIYGLQYKSIDGTGTLWRWSSVNGLEHLVEVDGNIGHSPSGGIVVTADGTVFGICQSGINSFGGALWKWSDSNGLELVTDFDGVGAPYELPLKGLTSSADGTLYGITDREQLYDPDTFEFVGYGAAKLWKWTETGGVEAVADVNIPGMTASGNIAVSPTGVVYGVAADDEAANYDTRPVKLWKWAGGSSPATVIHTFSGAANISSQIVFDAAGNAYGVTDLSGQIWKVLATGGGAVTQATLPATAGKYTDGSLYRDPATGQIYGLTYYKSTAPTHEGAVWRWTPSPSAVSIEATLAGWGPLGGNPQGVLVEPTGLVVGISTTNNGDSVLWRANGSIITPLATLPYATYGSVGGGVTLTKDASGNIYGLTSFGPGVATGCLWKWTAATGVVSKLATFGTTVPGNPRGFLVRDGSGNLYGLNDVYSSSYYYSSDSVVLWRASPTGVLTNLGSIHPSSIGHEVGSSLAINGNTVYGVCRYTGDPYSLNGATGGMIWKWTAARGIETALTAPGDPAFAPINILIHSNGTAYCTCSVDDDAAGDKSSVWQWSMISTETPTLVAEDYVFTIGTTTWDDPGSALIEGPDGALYSAFSSGGTTGLGTLWSLDPASTTPAFTILHDFTGASGANPPTQRIGFSADGALRGVAQHVVWKFGDPAPTGAALAVITGVGSSGISATTATINATVNPSGASTNIWIEYGPTAGNLFNVASATPSSLDATASATATTAALTGLTPNTTYFYRVAAQNVKGIVYSTPVSFKTLAALPPTVVTSAVVPATINAGGATLAGTVNPRGASVTAYCDFGLSATALTSTQTFPTALTGSTVQPVNFVITGLAPHTKYFFRMRASGNMGSTNGAVLSFITGNTAPVGVADLAQALPGAKITIPVCANDTDGDGDALTVFSFVPPLASHGTVTKLGGSLIFTPSATFTGPVTINYIAADATGAKTAATPVEITLADCTLSDTVVDAPAGESIDSIRLDMLSSAQLPTQNFRVVVPIDVTTSVPFVVAESLTWLSATVVIDPAAPSPQAILYIDQNIAKTPRSGIIKIGGISVTVNQAGVVAPSLDTLNLSSTGQIGVPYLSVLGVTDAPATLSLTGALPPGLTFYPASGIIAGVPTKDGEFTVTFKAVNAALPAGVTEQFKFTITPLPDGVVGAYAANVEREPIVNASLGARATFNITASGALTGSLMVEGAASSFTGVVNPEFDLNYTAGARVEVKRVGKPSYFLTLLIDALGNTVDGQMEIAGATLPAAAFLLGHRTPFSATNPAGDFDGRYVGIVKVDDAFKSPSVPAGDGYLTAVVTLSGAITLGGKLADGTAITGSALLGESPAVPDSASALLHVPLYTGTGSVHGSLEFTPSTEGVGLLGAASWLKKPQAAVTVRAYRSGFTADTTIEGWQWVKPPTTGNALQIALGSDNVEISTSGGEIELANQHTLLNRTFTLPSSSVGNFGTGLANPTSLALTVNATTGQFTGSFKVTDPDGYNPTKTVARTVAMEGVVVPGPNGNFGSGFFLLPKLQADADHPALPASPATGTSQLSGLVQFGAPVAAAE